MSTLLPVALRAAGACLLAAGALTVADTIRGRARASSDSGIAEGPRVGLLRGLATALAGRYDRSRRGARLQAKLEAAAVELEPSRWRLKQLAVATSAVVALTLLTGSLTTGLVVGGSGTRLAGWAFLRSRRTRADDLLEEAAAVLARHLATELAAGSSPAEALDALRGGELARERPRLAALATSTLARAAGGDGLATALGRSVADLRPGPGRDAVASVATALDLVVSRGSGTAVLARRADALEWRRRTRAEVSALSAEVRMAVLAIPLLTAIAAILLATSDQAVLAVALSPTIGMVSLLLVAMIAAGTLTVRRATAAA